MGWRERNVTSTSKGCADKEITTCTRVGNQLLQQATDSQGFFYSLFFLNTFCIYRQRDIDGLALELKQ